MSAYNRRSFIQQSSAVTAFSIAKSASSQVNSKLSVAAIGLNGVGTNIAYDFIDTGRAIITHTCDVDTTVLVNRTNNIANRQGGIRPTLADDFRAILENGDIDAVFIATPDHWHAYMTIAALQAGKDVYVEKPCAHNVWECHWMADAAKEYNRIVQHGTQQRSGNHFQQTKEYIKAGNLGDIAYVRNWGILGRGSIGHAAEVPVPSNFNYDMWLGPAPDQPFTQNRSHYNWRFFWDYGSGDMGNWGVHWIDTALWTLELGYPVSVAATGGKFIYDDDRETPDTLSVMYEYDGVTVSWELLMWANRNIENKDVGTAFYGDNGTLIIDRSGYDVIDSNGNRVRLSQNASNNMGIDHKHDFIDAIENRTPPIADIESGSVSSAVALLGNAAMLSGEKLYYNPESREFDGSDQNHLLTRTYRDEWALPQLVSGIPNFQLY